VNDVFSSEKSLTMTFSKKSKCFALNSGRDSSGHLQEIKTTKNTGWEFWIEFYIPDDYYLIYNIHQPNIRPTKSEISRVIGSGSFNFLELEKTVETKLGLPYNNCTKLNDWQDTYYVRQTKKNNMTYRKVNCIEECQDYLNEKYPYQNKTLIELSEFNNCYNLCPLECDSTIYKISETKLPNSPGKVVILLGYDSLKYTKITQSPKTKLSELISNLGGSAGLFLDLTFLSGCRAIEFILEIIFKY